MSNSNKKLKRRRRELFHEQDEKCHWCGRAMVLIEGGAQPNPVPKNMATLDHLRDRLHPARQEPAMGEQRYVAACWKCNHERGQRSQATLPIEELHERSGRHGLNGNATASHPPQAPAGEDEDHESWKVWCPASEQFGADGECSQQEAANAPTGLENS